MTGQYSRKARRRQITIEDLARHLGISKATVSLALNNSSLVADATKLRVIEAAEKFGYQPNFFGARLSRGKSDVIGLYIVGGKEEQCNWALPSSWMFYNPILKAVSTELSLHGYRLNLEVVSLERVIQKRVIASVIQEGSLDGMLIVMQDDTDHGFLNIVVERKFPFVVLNTMAGANISSVKIDNDLGARKSVNHLIELGHTRIAYLGGPARDSNAIERRRGFIKAISEAELNLDPMLVQYGDWQLSCGQAAAKKFIELDHPPTAIFCANDHMAIGVMQVLQKAGFRVPHDISVVGYDDTEMCQVVVPNLTTVRAPLELMGALGAREVLRQIDGEFVGARHTNLEPELVTRDSSAAAGYRPKQSDQPC
ncbi:MAG TPA: hypothetical protein DDW87_08540 [Firmicutes bacterium]|nr:hypothetical protein [Bacillota bacterium]